MSSLATAGVCSPTIGAYFDFIEAGGNNANGRNAAGFVEVWRVDAESVLIIGEHDYQWPEQRVEFIRRVGEWALPRSREGGRHLGMQMLLSGPAGIRPTALQCQEQALGDASG
ncbi:MAG: hypothetical protein LBD01_06800 [Puniceicoccales bacterium]|nr:hypothetical protein [Puniceicoccales bacterium]